MSKKSIKIDLFLIGMAAVIIGFCCPMFKGMFGLSSLNGFSLINFKHSTIISIGALCIFGGAVLGALTYFIPSLEKFKTIALIITIAGGCILILAFTTSIGSKAPKALGKLAVNAKKAVGKNILKQATYGFYIVITGWILSIINFITKK